MNVGLTYDLRTDYAAAGFSEEELAEFDSEGTIQALEDTLRALGHQVERIGNIYALTRQLCAGKTWDLVFNICEGLYGRSREAQVPALLEAYGIRYTFSDPLTLALTLDKALAKQVVRDAGLATADFFAVESPEYCREAAGLPLAFPLFLKPNSEGTGKGITADSIVRDYREFTRQCLHLLSTYRQPVLAEHYLNGREVTVGIAGTGQQARVLGVLEVKLLGNAEPGVYSYTNKELCEDRVEYSLVREAALQEEAAQLALGAYRVLGCRDAGRVDLRADADGKLYFLEVNPLAGLHPSHSDLPILCTLAGVAYPDLIASILSSALERPAVGAADRTPAKAMEVLRA